VAGSAELIETLIQFCRPYIYTTAMSPAQAEAIRCSLNIVRKDRWRREYLSQLVYRFRTHCENLGLEVLPSETPIQAVVISENEKTLQASQALLEKGLYVSAIRPPTVSTGTARLRVTFSAVHTEAQLDKLLQGMNSVAAIVHGAVS
jgi:8-amino-7-oxononanoate synthase